eukprot:TRINITY_DN27776_c0_g1_i1.p1 TRINITY_DN27776_c0_g1~~TRINITY_DN27776_c0_g1_i1.p1  ORF type:complete len:390 (-),score=52.15 TRINITY_DN27776_c0_g1_i1:4-1131(-)
MENLQSNVTVEDIRRWFGIRNYNVNVRLAFSNRGSEEVFDGWAGVYFSSGADARRALEEMDTMLFNGSPVKLSVGTSRDDARLNKKRKYDDSGPGGAMPPGPPSGYASFPQLLRGVPGMSNFNQPGRPVSPQMPRTPPKPPTPAYRPPGPLSELDAKILSVKVFFVIDFQTAVSTELVHIPLEISIIGVTGEKKDIASFHKFIDPGRIPQCHLQSAEFRKDVHGIPYLEPHFSDNLEKHYKNLWNDLKKFFLLEEHLNQPYIYGSSCAMQNACLDWICRKADSPNIFGKVAPVEELFERLLFVSNKNFPPTFYTLNILSAFHNPTYSPQLCQQHTDWAADRKSELEERGLTLQCALASCRYVANIVSKHLSILNK